MKVQRKTGVNGVKENCRHLSMINKGGTAGCIPVPYCAVLVNVFFREQRALRGCLHTHKATERHMTLMRLLSREGSHYHGKRQEISGSDHLHG